MASRGLGYDYGTGASGAGGKIRRRPASRAAASPYARPAPAPATAAATAKAASQGRGWFSRIISAGASRLLPSLFRKPPPQLAAPPAPPEPLDATHSPPEASLEPLLLQQDVGPATVQTEAELLNAPPSPHPPPLEDDLPDDDESGGAVANILATENSAKNRGEDMLRNSDEHSILDIEDLLKQRTFNRSEYEYLSELLLSRTDGSNSLKMDDRNVMKMHVSEKDLVASPAEIAKAYMVSKSANGSSLRLRLHDPSSLTIKSMEANMTQQARPPTIPHEESRLHTSNNSDRFKRNFSTPNRSAICKMSSSPYFKSASSDDLFSNVSSSYQTPSSVHTFGRQVLKRKSTTVKNDMVSVSPIRKMHQRYNRASPLLEMRPGYRGHLGSKLNEDSEHSAQTQKRRCLSKVGDATLGGLDDKACATSSGQAPIKSAEMAAKILKQLDTLVPSQKEVTPEIKQKPGDVVDVETCASHQMEVSVQSNLSEPSTSGVKENSLLDGINGNAAFTPAQVTEKSIDATPSTSGSLTTEFISQNTSRKDKPPTFSLRSHPPNLVLSSEVGRNKKPISSIGFSFPVPAVLGTQSQAPPTPTMTLPPVLPIEKLQPTAAPSASVSSVESGSRILKSVLEEGSIPQKCDKKLNADDQSSKNSGQVTSFTSNPVFKLANSKLPTLSNGLQPTLNSQQFGTASSFAAQDKSKAASPVPTNFSGNHHVQPENSNSTITEDSACHLSFKPSEKATGLNSQSLANPPVISAPLGSSFSGSSLFSSAAGSGSTSVSAAVSAFSAISSSTTGSGPVFSASPVFGSKLTTAASSPSSSAANAVFSFTAATTSIPKLSPTTPIFGGVSLATGSTHGTGQMNVGNMITDTKVSPFSTNSPFGIPCNSPSTPIFSTPATQFAPTTTASPEIFKFGEQNASSGAFSIGSGGGTEKSGRKFIRVKRRK